MKRLMPVLAAAAGLAVAACAQQSEYLDRRETIAMWAGDAQAVNTVTHAVHPLPPHAANRRLTADGERMERAHERYRTGQHGEDVSAPVN